MKRFKLTLFGIISACILCLLFLPIKAEAAAIIKPNKTISLKLNEEAPLYKITLEEDSLLKIEWSNNTTNFVTVHLYCDSKKKKSVFILDPNENKGSSSYSLRKGVYYIEMFDGYEGFHTPTAKVCFTWNPVSDYDKGNYCAAKAVNLNANKTTQVVQSPNYNFDTYYKIKLTTERKITIITTSYYWNRGYVDIFPEDWSYRYDTSYVDDNTRISDKVLPAGTYYLVVESFPKTDTYGVLGTYTTFKWK